MAVSFIREHWDGRHCTISSNGVRTYTRTFHVFTDDQLTGPLEILYVTDPTGQRLPRMWESYVIGNEAGLATGWDDGAWVRDIDPQQDAQDPRFWVVTVGYSSELPDPRAEVPGTPANGPGGPGGVGIPNTGGPSLSPTPLGITHAPSNTSVPSLPPTEVEWTFELFQEAKLRDKDGTVIANSAGQRFDPPEMFDEVRPTVRITRNEPNFSASIAQQYANKVNSDSFFGAAPRQAKINIERASLQFQQGVQFFRVTYRIQFNMRTKGWTREVYDVGYAERVDGRLKDILDDRTGAPVTSPYPLKDGLRWNPLDPQVLEFRAYDEIAFAPLQLIMS